MATTRNKPFKSSLPRLPNRGPSDFVQKLDPWFVAFSQLFKESASPERGKTRRSGTVKGGHFAETPAPSPPPAALPRWPATVGQMLNILANSEHSRFREAVKAIRDRIAPEAATIDVNTALLNVISLLKYQTMMPELQCRELLGDRTAGRQVVETTDLYNRWVHDQLPLEGCDLRLTYTIICSYFMARQAVWRG